MRKTAVAIAAILCTDDAHAQRLLDVIDGPGRFDALHQVHSVPDVDGDGSPELLIQNNSGSIRGNYVVLRSSAIGDFIWEARVTLSVAPTLTCDSDMALPLGDFDGDGDFDVAVGCSKQTSLNRGEVVIFDGPTGSELLRISVSGGGVGGIIGAVGDVNGDGFADVSVGGGEPWQDIFFGPDGRFGYRITGPTSFGQGATGIGDLDSDGGNDFALAWGADGVVTIHSGRTGDEIDRVCIFEPPSCPGQYGTRPVALGDVNSDGVPDLALSSPTWGEGLVRIISGADFSTIHEIRGRELTGTTLPEWFGAAFSGGHDVNGDGVNDLALAPGGFFYNHHSGVIISGRTGQILFRARPILSGGDLNMGYATTWASTIHDYDGDGFNDWTLGNYFAEFKGFDSGRIMVLSGGPGDVEHVCDALPHSQGETARIHFYDAITENSRGLEVRIEDAIPNEIAYVLYGPQAPPSVFGDGLLCIDTQNAVIYGGPIALDSSGAAERSVVWNDPLISDGAFAWSAGSSWTVQAVFRDPGAGGVRNTTNAIEVTFNE